MRTGWPRTRLPEIRRNAIYVLKPTKLRWSAFFSKSTMSLPPDYHTHTPLCRHAVGEPTELAAQALRHGLTEMGFSDHSPMEQDNFDEWRMALSDLPTYLMAVEQARRDHPALTIKIGLEVDYLPGHESWIGHLASVHPWDYFIGSVHYLPEHWAIDNPGEVSKWKEREPFEVWSAYFERLTKAAESRLFDFIGHADLCKKFCFVPKEDCKPLFQRFLSAAARTGVAIELNTGGLRKDCREIYPSAQILRLAFDTGVPITFGSDAHAPGEVGWEFARAVEWAKAAGYTRRSEFTQRRRSDVPL